MEITLSEYPGIHKTCFIRNAQNTKLLTQNFASGCNNLLTVSAPTPPLFNIKLLYKWQQVMFWSEFLLGESLPLLILCTRQDAWFLFHLTAVKDWDMQVGSWIKDILQRPHSYRKKLSFHQNTQFPHETYYHITLSVLQHNHTQQLCLNLPLKKSIEFKWALFVL